MFYMKKLALICTISCCSNAWAEIDLHTDEPTEDTSTQLQSMKSLQSLKSIPLNAEAQAPLVHDLKNRHNVRTLFVETQDLPMVDIQLTFDAGAARDGEIESGLSGLSTMAAKLMREGTQKYTAQQIAAVFDETGAQFSVQSYRDMFVVRLRTLSDPKKLETALRMLLEVLKNSTFKPHSIGMVVSNTQVGQKQLKENPSRLMDIQFYRTVYGAHPYAEPISGTIGSTKKITSEHLKKFRDQFLVAQNMNIAITGKLTAKQALALSERISTGIRQGQAAQDLSQPQANKDFVIRHLPYSASQAYVTMGHIGPARATKDKLALDIANRMFGGGGFNSVLMQELRVKRGLAYSAYSSFVFSQAPGIFSLKFSTREDQLFESIQVAHQAMIKFVNEPIDTQRLAETKAGMLRSFPNYYSSNASMNSVLGSMGFYHEPNDYLSGYAERLSKITAEDVQKAVRTHIQPAHLNLVILTSQLDQNALKTMLQQNLNTSHTTPH